MVLGGTLMVGFVWALIDLMIKIAKQPKREEPIDLVGLSSYPFVPDVVRIDDRRYRRR
jgi:hypothetical protein